MSFLEYLLDEAELHTLGKVETMEAASKRESSTVIDDKQANDLKNEKTRLGKLKHLRFFMRHLLAAPLYKAAKQRMPMASAEMLKASKELLPTSFPLGELAPYLGEALTELRHDLDLLLNVGPNGCMVSSMGDMLTPSIMQADGIGSGRIQNLFSAEGDVSQELLTLAVLKAMGPERYYQIRPHIIELHS